MNKKIRYLTISMVLCALFFPIVMIARETPVEVVIMYEDENGGVISEDVVELLPGLTVYKANPAFVPAGYTLISAPSVNIVVTSTGKISPEFIAFTYQSPKDTPTKESQPSSVGAAPATLPPAPIVNVGEVVTLGSYEQDGNQSNGTEAILWRVIKVEGDKALLLSDRNLDVLPYHDINQAVTWEISAMRRWLNDSFFQSAFDDKERALVLSTYISNPANHVTGTYSGVDTSDYIFLLSTSEVETMDIGLRKAANTAYVNGKGGYNRQGYGTYWLRTAGSYEKNAAIVNPEGEIGYQGYYMRDKIYSVRPTFWLDISTGLP